MNKRYLYLSFFLTFLSFQKFLATSSFPDVESKSGILIFSILNTINDYGRKGSKMTGGKIIKADAWKNNIIFNAYFRDLNNNEIYLSIATILDRLADNNKDIIFVDTANLNSAKDLFGDLDNDGVLAFNDFIANVNQSLPDGQEFDINFNNINNNINDENLTALVEPYICEMLETKLNNNFGYEKYTGLQRVIDRIYEIYSENNFDFNWHEFVNGQLAHYLTDGNLFDSRSSNLQKSGGKSLGQALEDARLFVKKHPIKTILAAGAAGGLAYLAKKGLSVDDAGNVVDLKSGKAVSADQVQQFFEEYSSSSGGGSHHSYDGESSEYSEFGERDRAWQEFVEKARAEYEKNIQNLNLNQLFTQDFVNISLSGSNFEQAKKAISVLKYIHENQQTIYRKGASLDEFKQNLESLNQAKERFSHFVHSNFVQCGQEQKNQIVDFARALELNPLSVPILGHAAYFAHVNDELVELFDFIATHGGSGGGSGTYHSENAEMQAKPIWQAIRERQQEMNEAATKIQTAFRRNEKSKRSHYTKKEIDSLINLHEKTGEQLLSKEQEIDKNNADWMSIQGDKNAILNKINSLDLQFNEEVALEEKQDINRLEEIRRKRIENNFKELKNSLAPQ